MGVTALTMLDNRSSRTVVLLNFENPNTQGNNIPVPPGSSIPVNMWVPWATTAADFPAKHLQLQVGPVSFWIWQCGTNEDGDHVRFSMDGAWHDHGRPVHGISAVDAISASRTIVVRDNCFELTEMPSDLASIVRTALGPGGYRMTGQFGDRPVPSVPKGSAVAFSMAGPPSDAFAKNVPGAQWLYRDEGKRYVFTLSGGVVAATHPDGTQTALTSAISFHDSRTGQHFTAPAFDLIAANGGRVFAKEQGVDRFYFATMDQMSVGVGDDGRLLTVPSNYFKIDPKFNQPGALTQDLTQPFEGCFGGHPGASRFPLFQFALAQNLIDMLVVNVQPRVWHLLDLRPPLGTFNLEVLAIKAALGVSDLSPLLQVPFFQSVLALIEQATLGPDIAPPQDTGVHIPTYQAVTYSASPVTPPMSLPAIDFDQVLDIGVGHVHWHEQYEGVTGGELQPLFGPSLTAPPLPQVTSADLYRFANGPVSDGDGYIDGTCNYYALVHLRGGGFALLYADEQSYFVQRWRMVDPEDSKGMPSLAAKLQSDPGMYNWNQATYWCPLRVGQIAANSRLAVSRQVLLVTAPDPLSTDPAHPRAVVYSINFSFSTMDRTWRWRSLPGQAEYFGSDAERTAEPINASLPNRVYPETIRLREDMTIHVKGTQQQPDGSITVGRWVQRYLPAGNHLVPAAPDPAGNRPATGYQHPWRFLPEPVFEAADHFSHLGVYGAVDSRTQYYPVMPVGPGDALALEDGERDQAPWVDDRHQICTRLLEFQWAAPLRLPDVDTSRTVGGLRIAGPPRSPVSLFNQETRLRIRRRGTMWTAQHWDKRDDDLIPFDGLPSTVTLTKGRRTAAVTVQPNAWVPQPPAVPAAQFTWTGNPQQPVQIALTRPANVWRVRLAALDPVPSLPAPGASPAAVRLLDVEYSGRFTVGGDGVARFAWVPTARLQAALARYCTPAGALAHGTSLWFEDIVGHVSVPDALAWSGNPPALSVSGRLWHTIRNPDGSWTGAGDVNGQIGNPGPVGAVAAASSSAGLAQFIFATTDGGLWHTIRNPDGSWTGLGNVKGQIGDPGAVGAVAAASSSAGLAQFIFATTDGGLWHTIRNPDGSWTRAGDVKVQIGDPGAVGAVAAASSSAGLAQFIFATTDGGLWHTIRNPDGSWTRAGDVKGQIGNPGIVVAVAAASSAPGEAQFMVATADGGLWHTVRRPDGSWTRAGDVKGQIGNPGSVVAVAAGACAPQDVQFMFATADGGLWHTIRQPDGSWTGAGNVKGQIGNPGAISAVAAASSSAGLAQFLFT
jgi:hypothetical protein